MNARQRRVKRRRDGRIMDDFIRAGEIEHAEAMLKFGEAGLYLCKLIGVSPPMTADAWCLDWEAR